MSKYANAIWAPTLLDSMQGRMARRTSPDNIKGPRVIRVMAVNQCPAFLIYQADGTGCRLGNSAIMHSLLERTPSPASLRFPFGLRANIGLGLSPIRTSPPKHPRNMGFPIPKIIRASEGLRFFGVFFPPVFTFCRNLPTVAQVMASFTSLQFLHVFVCHSNLHYNRGEV